MESNSRTAESTSTMESLKTSWRNWQKHRQSEKQSMNLLKDQVTATREQMRDDPKLIKKAMRAKYEQEKAKRR